MGFEKNFHYWSSLCLASYSITKFPITFMQNSTHNVYHAKNQQFHAELCMKLYNLPLCRKSTIS